VEYGLGPCNSWGDKLIRFLGRNTRGGTDAFTTTRTKAVCIHLPQKKSLRGGGTLNRELKVSQARLRRKRRQVLVCLKKLTQKFGVLPKKIVVLTTRYRRTDRGECE